MSGFYLDLDAAAIDDLGFDEDAEEMLEDVGTQVAALAKEKAPKDSGEGADSIFGQPGQDNESAYVDIGPDKDHFYMVFHETGTEHETARPYLRPALDQTQV